MALKSYKSLFFALFLNATILFASISPGGIAKAYFIPPPSPQTLIAKLLNDEKEVQFYYSLITANKQGDFNVLDVSWPLLGSLSRQYRDAIRIQQKDLFSIASNPSLSIIIEDSLPPSLLYVHDVLAAWRSIWSLAQIDDYSLLRLHLRSTFNDTPLSDLSAFYLEASQKYKIAPEILAAINYIESDFGRVSSESTAGAQGPMQFLPSTWDIYGKGDIHSPHDSILAAAHYLFANGGYSDISVAIYAYNHDSDYVSAVLLYAKLIKSDPSWLPRLYYWNTSG